jgi:integrase/recombinase XerD
MASEIEQGLSQNSDSRKQGEATGLDNLIQGYSLYARTEGKSLKTISITVTALTRLKGFLRINGLSGDVTQLSAHQIREFIQYLQQAPAFENHRYTKPQARGLSGHAINCYLRAIRAFWSWMVREEIIYSNPFAKVTIPKAPRKVIPTFSQSQLQALLGAIDSSRPAGFRDSTMIMVLLDSGLRASELLGLTVTNLNLDDGVVKVNGKGGKERMVPIGAKVRRMIWRYLQRYRPQPVSPRCDILFLSERGEPLSVNRLEAMIERCGQRAGVVGVRCSPHTFRHTFAITYLRNGGDVFSLQRILGHTSLDTVRLYVNLAEADVRECHRKYSPADNMELDRRCRRSTGREKASGLAQAEFHISRFTVS